MIDLVKNISNHLDKGLIFILYCEYSWTDSKQKIQFKKWANDNSKRISQNISAYVKFWVNMYIHTKVILHPLDIFTILVEEKVPLYIAVEL